MDKYQDLLLKYITYQHKRDYFICGESDEKAKDGLPNKFLVCPVEGSDSIVIYERKRKIGDVV